jgi:hypothetical protein
MQGFIKGIFKTMVTSAAHRWSKIELLGVLPTRFYQVLNSIKCINLNIRNYPIQIIEIILKRFLKT